VLKKEDQIMTWTCLDEFVFRLDRRQTPVTGFQTLLGLGST